MDEQFFAELTEVMRWKAGDDDVTAVVVTGYGGPGVLRARGRRNFPR